MGTMRTKYARPLCAIAIALAGVASMRAQDLRDANFSGVISDYTPSTVSGGPYEFRGTWSLDIHATAN